MDNKNINNSEIINSSEYSYQEKKKISSKLQKISNKKQMIDIINIIKKNNSEFITIHSDGTRIKFNCLTTETYKKLEEYLSSIDISTSLNNYTPISTSFVPYSDCEEYNVKLNTKEKSLLNHEKYINDINKNNK